MALTEETEKFIVGWKAHAASCVEENEIAVMFNKFSALIHIYNRLYIEVSRRLGVEQKDKKGATLDVIQYLTANALVLAIETNQQTRAAELQLREFVRNHTYNFNLDGEQRDPNNAKDDRMLANMVSANKATRMEGLLVLIYAVRCNFVHGQKPFLERQLPLMHAVIPILELVSLKVEEKLRAEAAP